MSGARTSKASISRLIAEVESLRDRLRYADPEVI